jgi:hypothetical protein
MNVSEGAELIRRARGASVSRVGMDAHTPAQMACAAVLASCSFDARGAWGYVCEIEPGLNAVAQFLHDPEDQLYVRMRDSRRGARVEFPFEKRYPVADFAEETLRMFDEEASAARLRGGW